MFGVKERPTILTIIIPFLDNDAISMISMVADMETCLGAAFFLENANFLLDKNDPNA